MTSPRVLLAATLLAAATTAQTYSAYPIDDLHGVFGHWAPFGILSTGNADEVRCHYMVPAPYLPSGGGSITGIAVSPHVTGNVPYERLIVRVGLTTATTLSPLFANNATSFTTVYSQANFSINWNSRTQWFPITFSTPFPWDGTSSVVIEVEKVVDRPNNPTLPTISHQHTTAPMRTDLPLPIFREGSYGSGAAVAPNGSAYNGGPMLMRLLWAGDPTLNITSTRSGRPYFHLGATMTLEVQAMPGELFGVFLDDMLAPAGQPVPPVNGLYWLSPRFILLGTGGVGGGGTGSLSLTIPNNNRLVGVHLYYQAVVASLTRLVLTNVVDGIIAQ